MAHLRRRSTRVPTRPRGSKHPKNWGKNTIMEVAQNYKYHFGGPCNMEYSILGSILGSAILVNY